MSRSVHHHHVKYVHDRKTSDFLDLLADCLELHVCKNFLPTRLILKLQYLNFQIKNMEIQLKFEVCILS